MNKLFTNHSIQVVLAFLTKEFLEVVVQRIGVTNLRTVLLGQCDSGHTLILLCRYILNIIGRCTKELLVVSTVVVVAYFTLELQVLVDFPSEGTAHVQLNALLTLVIILNRGQRTDEVVAGISVFVVTSQTGNGEWRVLHSQAQTLVSIVGTALLVGTRTVNLCT